jgi:uncharacterized protein YndB with AHSA1/START domain
MRRLFPCLLLACAPALAAAAVDAPAPDGFVATFAVTVPVPRAAAFAEVLHPERWWNPQHTWSGDAAHMTLDAHAGGCWCERWDGGEARHGTVVRVLRDSGLRVDAAFGPLQAMAVNGVFDVTLADADGGGTRITVTYRVSGPASAHLDQLAAPVDGVIGEQVERLRARLAGEARP